MLYSKYHKKRDSIVESLFFVLFLEPGSNISYFQEKGRMNMQERLYEFLRGNKKTIIENQYMTSGNTAWKIWKRIITISSGYFLYKNVASTISFARS